MWEKSVANDENDCNDENDECEMANVVEKANENVTSQKQASRERLSINLYDNQEFYQGFSKLRLSAAVEENDVIGERRQPCPALYYIQNGFYSEKPSDLQLCNVDNQAQEGHTQAISQIKPSNTYPIIKDLNKLRSMSLPSIAVGDIVEDKNDDYDQRESNDNNKFDKKFDDDGDNNAGGGFSNNDNYSFNYVNECNHSSSHRYAKNSYLNERGVNNNSSNTNDICTDNAIRESASVISSKNQSHSSKNEIDLLDARVKSSRVELRQSGLKEVESTNEDEEEDEENEEPISVNVANGSTEVGSEVNGNMPVRTVTSTSQSNSQSKCDVSSVKSTSMVPMSKQPSWSYALNGNIVARANIVVKPCNNCDQSKSSSSSYLYYYTTATETSTESSQAKHHSPKSPSKVLPTGSSSSLSNRRASVSYSSRSSFSNNSHFNNIPVLSFPKESDHSLGQPNEEMDKGSPMSQGSSQSNSSSVESESSINRRRVAAPLQAKPGPSSGRALVANRVSGHSESSSSVAPITPPSSPPPLIEVVSTRRKRFFVQ